jgi:hypothetical protein
MRAFRDFRQLPPGDAGGGRSGSTPGPERFAPFDGSRPLLPPFRPATPEAAFSYHGARVREREEAAGAAAAARRVVAVRGGGAGEGTLFAEVVQEEGLRDGLVWLRPLMLRNGSAGEAEWIDLRQTSDVFLERAGLDDAAVDAETRTVLDIMLIAAEGDLWKRVVDLDDTHDLDRFRNVLSRFLQTRHTAGE